MVTKIESKYIFALVPLSRIRNLSRVSVLFSNSISTRRIYT